MPTYDRDMTAEETAVIRNALAQSAKETLREITDANPETPVDDLRDAIIERNALAQSVENRVAGK